MKILKYSPEAARDLENIKRIVAEEFGESVAVKTMKRIGKGIRTLEIAENAGIDICNKYDSFGNEVNPDSKDDNPFRYCGEYYDKETEEIYLRERYYQLAVGRFLTRDSYTGDDEPENLHLYTYCENDGINCIDPSGHVYIVVSGGRKRNR